MENTSYAKLVKCKLIEIDKTQAWLIEQISKKTGLYCDTALLSKIFRGATPAKKIVDAINEILNLSPEIDGNRDGEPV